MKLNKPKNPNYCGTVVKIGTLIPIEKCDNIQVAMVLNNRVVVSKATQVGDIGIFFPIESQLSKEFLSKNNLYRHTELNSNPEAKGGFFEDSGRIRCVKLRNTPSEGFFIPLTSVEFTGVNISEFNIGDEFDELNGINICKKYYVVFQHSQGLSKSEKRNKKIEKVSRMVEGQFRLHIDTEQLKKNIHRVNPDDLVSITVKCHGSSAVIGKVLVQKKLDWKHKLAKMIGIKVIEKEYDLVYSSRNVIKNEYFATENSDSYYSENIWQQVAERIKDVIPNGITLYGEIVGYVTENSFIQKNYHYNCLNGTNKFYVYRVTFTNQDGKVFEFTRPQIDEFCKMNNLEATPLCYYGFARDIYPEIPIDEHWHENLLAKMDKDEKFGMNNIMCPYNNYEVPSEGCVLRIEKLSEPIPLKLKNFKFLERETKELDESISNIEDEN